jgi:dTDP-4-dehydrorhamnose reductase
MILILGSNGLFGSYFKNFLNKRKLKYKTIGKKNCDINGNILDYKFLKKSINIIKPQYIINLAAMTNIEKCEENKLLAKKLNIILPKNISVIINKKTFFIHFSTDHIYSKNFLQKENSKIKFLNYYAKSKYLGEKSINHRNKCILRTNFFGKSKSNRDSFTDWIFMSIKKKKKVFLYNDVFFSPLSMQSLSKYIMKIINKKIIGTYNLGSNNGMSKKDFCLCFAHFLKKKLIYESINIDKVNLKVKKPKDMRMNNQKIEKKLKIKLNNLTQELKISANEYI